MLNKFRAVPSNCNNATASFGYQTACWDTVGSKFQEAAIGVGVAAILIALLQVSF